MNVFGGDHAFRAVGREEQSKVARREGEERATLASSKFKGKPEKRERERRESKEAQPLFGGGGPLRGGEERGDATIGAQEDHGAAANATA
ncbi:hypothetical protein HPB50_011436 [Hyalomma asiaticum]|uniref:Uncharacterized protein n=1 Tax=Hyalomma asiaticum TaxID=266040 RepID=A0ACB7SQ51_HYAAI|nr:hypothetical protein HPB50_011436 [Hyalomma asiaticum]